MQLKKELEKMETSKDLEKLTQEEKTEKDKNLWKNWLLKYRYYSAKLVFVIYILLPSNIEPFCSQSY